MADAALPPGLDGEALQRALGIAPFHAWLGLRILSSGDGRLEIEMPWRDEIVSNPRIGSAHGGVLASLIDLAGMYAILTQTTAGPIRVRSEVVKLGRSLSVASAELFGPSERLVASGRGSYLMR